MQCKIGLHKADKLSWVEAHIGKTMFEGLANEEDSSIAEDSDANDDDHDELMAIIQDVEEH